MPNQQAFTFTCTVHLAWWLRIYIAYLYAVTLVTGKAPDPTKWAPVLQRGTRFSITGRTK